MPGYSFKRDMSRICCAIRIAFASAFIVKARALGFALVLASLGPDAWAISSSVPLKLEAGWNLISSPKDPDGALFRLYKGQGLTLWRAAVLDAPERKNRFGAGLLVELEAFDGRGGVWVFAPGPVELPQAEVQDASLRPAGWNVLRVGKAIRLADPSIATVFHWDRTQARYTRIQPGEWLHPGEGYWAQFLEPGVSPFLAPSAPASGTEPAANPSNPPSAFSATSQGETAFLSWAEPTRLEDGTPIGEGVQLSYRVDRDGVQVGRSTEPEFRDAVPTLDRVYRYEVYAVLEAEAGATLTSDASDPISLLFASPKPVASADRFEAPSVASDENASVALPQVAVSGRGEQILAHLVYVMRATEDRGAELRYRLSPKAAKGQSFETLHRISTSSTGWHITDVSISALEEKVSIAWIQRREGDGAASEIWVAQSGRAGAHFDPPKRVRSNVFWKRGLDVGYDRLGGHHLVWGEANKVYYMKNLDGKVENVFDVVVREKNDIVVRYRMLYKAACEVPDEPCDCFETADEQYTYALEEHADTGELLGPYRYRVEEAWVYNPSLRIDAEKVSIVASQDRMWDNRPVRNPNWRGEYGPLVPPRVPSALAQSAWCGEEGSRHNQEGFMQVWLHRSGHAGTHKPAETSPDERARLLAMEEDPASAFAYYYGEGKQNFVSYDPRVGHDRDWYFYLYDGTWHEEDQIRVAQRPLTSHAWSEERIASVEVPVWPIEQGLLTWTHETLPVEQGWRQGSYKDDHFQNWRLSVVSVREASADQGGAESADQGGAEVVRPKIVADPEGRLVVVYEDGVSNNPNEPGYNAITVSVSTDGGELWSEPTVVGRGYLPDAAALADGEVAVVYYEARESEDASDVSKIQLTRSRDLKNWTRAPISLQAPRAIHWETHGAAADALVGVPSLTAYEDLFLVSWIRQAKDAFAHDAVVTTRASNDSRASHFDISHHGALTVGKSSRFTVAAVNKYNMRVNASGTVEVTKRGQGSRARVTPDASFSVGGLGTKPPAGSLARSTELPEAADGKRPSALAVASPSTVHLEGGEAELWTVVDDPETTFFVQDAEGSLSAETTSKAFFAFSADASGNYDRALRARNALLRRDQERGWVYQVEYAPDDEDPEVAAQGSRDPGANGRVQGHLEDARHLAGFERVWVYTQGIALAQFSRKADTWSVEVAQGLARYLCDRAQPGVFEGEEIIRGWPFSWNTLDDSWRDARLVTGATAWAIHGLGSFVASEAYTRLEEGDRSAIQSCYHRALHGLKEHRRQVWSPRTGETVTLMTAGWTTRGLQHASTPALLPPPFQESEDIHWAYYSVLDAIGYDSFDEVEPPFIQRWQEGKSIEALELSKGGLAVLQEPVLAENVVTEHNLDVLSVLNHALLHHKKTGLTHVEELRAWRDELRAGIFEVLWDDRGWKDDLQRTLGGEGISPERRAHIEHVLEQGALGRIITGGELLGDTEPKVLAPSPHVAIDNCSWLSLSVDFDELPPDSVYIERLAQCLEFTELHFAKDLSFGTRSYYGTHYFQNAFKDPYIDESELQDSSFHLEATTGLILGLHRFAKAHPSHDKSEWFRARASALWDGVQSFVRDHGFPYSSQRIHNLSTLLSSSTAVIWFIDVHDALGDGHDVDRAAKHEVSASAMSELWKWLGLGEAGTRPQSSGSDFAKDTWFQSVELNLDGQNVLAVPKNDLFEAEPLHEPLDLSFKMMGLELSGAKLEIHEFAVSDELMEFEGVLSLCDGKDAGCIRSIEIDPPALALGLGQLLALSLSSGLEGPSLSDEHSNPRVTQVGAGGFLLNGITVIPFAVYYYELLGLGVGPAAKGLVAALPWIVTLGVMKGFRIPYNFSRYSRSTFHTIATIVHSALIGAFTLEQRVLPIQPLNRTLWQIDAALEAGGEALRFHMKAPNPLHEAIPPLDWGNETQQDDVTNATKGVEPCLDEACPAGPINVASASGAVELVSALRVDAAGLLVELSYDTKGEERELELYLVSEADEIVGFYESRSLTSEPTRRRFVVPWLANEIPAEGRYQVWIYMIDGGASCAPGCQVSHAHYREWLHIAHPYPDQYTVRRLSPAPHEADSERISLVSDRVGELSAEISWMSEVRELLWIAAVSRNVTGKEPYRTLFAQVDSGLSELEVIRHRLEPDGEAYQRHQALGANAFEKWFLEMQFVVNTQFGVIVESMNEISAALEEPSVIQVVEDPWMVESSSTTDASFRLFRDRLLTDVHPFGVETLLDLEGPTLVERLVGGGGSVQSKDYAHYLAQTKWPATEWGVYRWLLDAESGAVRAYADGFVESYGALGVEAFQRLDAQLLATSFAGGTPDFRGARRVGRYYPLEGASKEKLEVLLRRSGYELEEVQSQIRAAGQGAAPLARESHSDRIRIVSGKTLRDPVPVNLWPGANYHLGVSYIAGGRGRELLVRLEHVDTGDVAHAVKPVAPTDGYEFASLSVTMPKDLQSGRYRWDALIRRADEHSASDARHREAAVTPFYAQGLSGSKTPTEFVRLDGSLLKAALTRYRSPGTSVEVSLVSMIHVGRAEYYKEASRYLNEMDLVLSEGVALDKQETDLLRAPTDRQRTQIRNSIAGLALLQSWFGLTSQRIEGPPELFRRVDFDPETIAEQAKEAERTTGKRDTVAAEFIHPHPLEHLFTTAFSRGGAFAFETIAPGLRNVLFEAMFVRPHSDLSSDREREIIVVARNLKVLSVLDELLVERDSGRIGILYGAGHMPHFEKELFARDFVRTETVWLTAMSTNLKPVDAATGAR